MELLEAWAAKFAKADEVYAIACYTFDDNIVSWVGSRKLEVEQTEVARDPTSRKLWTDKKVAHDFLRELESGFCTLRLVVLPRPTAARPFGEPCKERPAYTDPAPPGWCIQISFGPGHPKKFFCEFRKRTYRTWPSRSEAETFRKEMLKLAYLPHMLKVVPSPLATSPRKGRDCNAKSIRTNRGHKPFKRCLGIPVVGIPF